MKGDKVLVREDGRLQLIVSSDEVALILRGLALYQTCVEYEGNGCGDRLLELHRLRQRFFR